MAGRFIAFIWMMIGLLIFGFFTSTITNLVNDFKVEAIIVSPETVYQRALDRLDPMSVCSVQGVYEEILGPAIIGDVKTAVSDCYAKFATETVRVPCPTSYLHISFL